MPRCFSELVLCNGLHLSVCCLLFVGKIGVPYFSHSQQYSSMHYMRIEYLICTGNCTRCWEYSHQQQAYSLWSICKNGKVGIFSQERRCLSWALKAEQERSPISVAMVRTQAQRQAGLTTHSGNRLRHSAGRGWQEVLEVWQLLVFLLNEVLRSGPMMMPSLMLMN